MANASLFGGAFLTSPPYVGDADQIAIFVGHRFSMVSVSDHWVAGVRCFPGTGGTANLANCWGFLLSSSGAVLAKKQFATTLTKNTWNEILFDNAVLVDAAAGYIAGVYYPGGGYAFRTGVFTTDMASADDAPHFIGIGGGGNNGVFATGSINASTVTAFSLTGTSGTHYGTDVVIGAPHLGTTLSNTTAPVITPTTGIGPDSVLTCSTGTWAGSPTLYARQWRVAGVDVAGETGSSYTVREDDIGLAITCAVVASSSAGAVRAISNSVTPAPTTTPTNAVAPSITPATGVHVGDVVSVSAGTWHQAPTSYSFQRQRDSGVGFANVGAPIVDADGQIQFTPSPSDQAYSTRFSVTATNVFGESAAALSNAIVAAAEPPLPGANARNHLLVDGTWVTVNYGSAVVAEHPPVYRPDVNLDETPRVGWHGDGVTNDAVAWRAAFAEAYQAALDSGSHYYKIQHPGGVSYVGGLVSGLYSANAILPVPLQSASAMKVIGVLKGTDDQVTWHHWQQLVPQRAGCVIRTDTVGATGSQSFVDASPYGRPSVIGGPTPQQGYGAGSGNAEGGAMWSHWNNTMLKIDGVTIEVPIDPHICGADMRGMAQANIENLAVLVPTFGATPPAVAAIGDASASQEWQFGLATPETNNNAKSRLGQIAGVGQNYVALISEHTIFEHITALFCTAACEFGSSGQSTAHDIEGGKILAENCQLIIGTIDGAYPLKINIGTVASESISFAAINDTNHRLLGTIRSLTSIGDGDKLVDFDSGASGLKIRGAGNLRVYDGSRQKGVLDLTLPASGASSRNPFWRDCEVHLSAAPSNVEITDIAGVSSWVSIGAAQRFLLGTGHYYRITYTGTPTAKAVIV